MMNWELARTSSFVCSLNKFRMLPGVGWNDNDFITNLMEVCRKNVTHYETGHNIIKIVFVLLQQTAGKVIGEIGVVPHVGEEGGIIVSDREDFVEAAGSGHVNGDVFFTQASYVPFIDRVAF